MHTGVVLDEIRERMRQAVDPIAEGIRIAREVLALAREHFAGACIMPPFDHFEVMPDILSNAQDMATIRITFTSD